MNKPFAAAAFIGAIAFGAGSAHAAIDDAAAANLMKTAGCRACHSVDKKLVGPAYKDVAAKRKGQADAIAVLTKAVRTGSKGVYGGPVAMPPTDAARISDSDLHDLLEWVLSR
jgi:cytochrome c